jgi:hypothetical protein
MFYARLHVSEITSSWNRKIDYTDMCDLSDWKKAEGLENRAVIFVNVGQDNWYIKEEIFHMESLPYSPLPIEPYPNSI